MASRMLAGNSRFNACLQPPRSSAVNTTGGNASRIHSLCLGCVVRRHAPEGQGTAARRCTDPGPANLSFQRDGKPETPLIGAASLGAEEVGLRLLEAGANPEVRGLFGETGLHWAALLGEDRLAERLIEGADLNLKAEKYKSSPFDGRSTVGPTHPPATTADSARW